ncbi:MAG: metal ABC transporter substrate-binding protein [Dehalococcoidia bacterium]|nr:metal ABC transporter substrate-binding protein [Dehalococcoidia bacterium]
MSRATIGVVIALSLVLVGCAPSAQHAASGGPAAARKLNVVTTVAPLTSIAENIGGSRIALIGVIPEGNDSHTFEPAPSVARVMSGADLIIVNGLSLEDPTLQMAKANKKADAVILMLGESTITRADWIFDFSFPESEGHPNPHLWINPMYALRYAELVEQQLAKMDAANADYYAANLSRFRDKTMRLDAGIKAVIQTIPAGQRKLLTYHDSWAYFAKRYGMEVIGAVQPSDFKEPSAREVAQLIDQIKREKVPAVFGSDVYPSKVLEQIAREGGATFVDKLRDDELPGKPGEPFHTYFGLMLENMNSMVSALGGNVDALKGFDPAPVFEGPSGAVYIR